MRKNWKRVLGLLLLVVMVFTLSACGKSSFYCQLCDKTYEGKGHPETVFGNPVTLCDKCYSRVKK